MNPPIEQQEIVSTCSPLGLRQLDHWSLVVAVSNDRVLQTNLLASPAIDARCQVITKRGFPSASKAYNSGIAEARHEIIVFAHQDVHFPRDWTTNIERALSRLAVEDPNWGVLGVVGMEKDLQEVTGYCYSTGLQMFVGKPFSRLVEARSLDEIVLVIRRSSGLTFDEGLPGFHLYGTDICLEAEKRKLKSYAASAFCIHNTNGIKSFPMDFWRAYFYLRRKWRGVLPIQTCCTKITRWAGPAMGTIARDFAHRVLSPRKVGRRWEDPDRLYQVVERERTELGSQ